MDRHASWTNRLEFLVVAGIHRWSAPQTMGLLKSRARSRHLSSAFAA
jgi:hypothetical protein